MFRSMGWLLAISLGLAGCSPTFNWRTIPVGPDGVKALLPCKPDRGSRYQTLAGQTVNMHMVGCEAGGMVFAVAYVELGADSLVEPAQQQWQAAWLVNMQAATHQVIPLTAPPGVTQHVRLSAQGQRGDGQRVYAQALWFARGKHLYHAVAYGEAAGTETSEPFFSGFEFP